MDKETMDFLIKAKKETYANESGTTKKDSTRSGSKDYEYKDGNMVYHDTYFGGTNFIGEEVVYINSNIPLWGMNYYGVTIDDSVSEEAMDKALRPALMKVGEDISVIPVRGPRRFENDKYSYEFKVDGTIENFNGIEEIYKEGKLIYRLYCNGGCIK